MPWPTRLRDWIVPQPEPEDPDQVQPGLHHFQKRIDGGYMRYHLRVDPDGPGVLIAGASEAVLLSPAGTAAALGLLQGRSPERLASELHVPNGTEVVEEVAKLLVELGHPNSRFPIFNLIDPEVVGARLNLVAPFQADVVAGPGSNLTEILNRLWNTGIPHVRLIWPREFPHSYIVRGVTHAEDLGMIAGVRATATQLSHSGVLEELAKSGLDYVVVPWGVTADYHREIFGPDDWDLLPSVIKSIQNWELTPIMDVPLHPAVMNQLEPALAGLIERNVHHVEVFALVAMAADQTSGSSSPTASLTPAFAGQELRQLAGWIEDLAEQLAAQIIWLPPVVHDPSRSLFQTASLGPRAGGDVTIRVEIDGRVVPPRGPYRVAGNLLTQPWHRIWEDEAFTRYRDLVESPTRCDQCPGLAICAADCPADPRGWVVPPLPEP